MNIPSIPHWAIITTSQVYVAGDERSRTSPGHGYPEHYEETIQYESFKDYSAFVSRVSILAKGQYKFKAVQVIPLEVEVEVKVNIKQ